MLDENRFPDIFRGHNMRPMLQGWWDYDSHSSINNAIQNS